eukprot:jgi/Chrzof1/4151/Cz14g00290.t1
MARSTFDDFVVREKIGSGSYGVVYKVVRKVDRQTYALKEIDLQGLSRKEQEECIRETQILSHLDSQHIIRYYDSFLEKGKLFIVTEFAAGGNLHDFVKRQKQKLPEELVWRLYIQMLLGLNHMHKRKILHRDFKTLNVFLDDKFNVKLGDLGVAKVLTTHTAFAKTIVGTPYYLSPELCEDKPYNEKSDVWALGVTLYECCTQRHPFDADNQGALILKILRGMYPAVEGYSKELISVIKACLTLDVRKRPDTEKLLAQKSFRQWAAQLGIELPPLTGGAKAVQVSLVGGVGGAAAAAAPGEIKVSPRGGSSTTGVHGGMQRKSSSSVPSQSGVGSSGTIKAAAPATKPPAAGRPRSGNIKSKDAAAVTQAVADLPHIVGSKGDAGGVIHLTGDMASPPAHHTPARVIPPPAAATATALSPRQHNNQQSEVPAFMFGSKAGSTSPAAATAAPATAVHVSIRHQRSTSGDVLMGVGGGSSSAAVAPDWAVREAGATDASAAAAMGNLSLEPSSSSLRYEDSQLDDVASVESLSGRSSPNPGGAAGGGGGRSSSTEAAAADQQRLQHMRQVLPQLRASIIDVVGQRAFDALYLLLRMTADAAADSPRDRSSGAADNNGEGADITTAELRKKVLRIIPESKLDVMPLIFKLLYCEGQLS